MSSWSDIPIGELSTPEREAALREEGAEVEPTAILSDSSNPVVAPVSPPAAILAAPPRAAPPGLEYSHTQEPKATQSRVRYGVVTVFNYDCVNFEGEVVPSTTELSAPCFMYRAEEAVRLNKFSFVCGQSEISPTTGRPHLQVYVERKTQTDFKALRRMDLFRDLPPGSKEFHWIQKARGTAADNEAYCSKDDSFDGYCRFSFGVPSNLGQGGRSDLLSIKRAIDAGDDDFALWSNEANFGVMVRYHRSFNQYRNVRMRASPNNTQRRVIVLWGPAGTGKSHTAYRLCDSYYPVPDAKGSGLYFDAYAGEKAIVFDEMGGHRCAHSFLLNLCGDGPIYLPVHGGQVPLASTTTHVIFTANEHPYYWYQKLYEQKPELWRAMERRIEDVRHMTDRYVDDNVVVRNWPVPPPVAPHGVPNNILHHL